MIVKKVATACLCMVLGSSLNAKNMSENEVFIGLEVGYSEVQGERIGLVENTGDDVSYGFRIGAQDDEWRAMFLFNFYDNSENDQNVEQGLLAIDYFFLGDKSTFRPYMGFNIGYANYESTFVEDSGLMYGGQVGFVVVAMDTIDLDFSYRYSLSNASAFDHVGSFIFGIHFKL